jgi:hypothetical protein
MSISSPPCPSTSSYFARTISSHLLFPLDEHQKSYLDIQVTPLSSQDETPTISMGQTQFFEQEKTGARSSDPGEYDGCRETYDEHGERIGCYVCWETGGIEGVTADEGCLRIE